MERCGTEMNIIYNSDQYWVLEYPGGQGYELVDKRTARGAYLQGDVARRFAVSMQKAIAEEATVEHVDEFLDGYDAVLDLPIVYH